jgi:hypothetical protein
MLDLETPTKEVQTLFSRSSLPKGNLKGPVERLISSNYSTRQEWHTLCSGNPVKEETLGMDQSGAMEERGALDRSWRFGQVDGEGPA